MSTPIATTASASQSGHARKLERAIAITNGRLRQSTATGDLLRPSATIPAFVPRNSQTRKWLHEIAIDNSLPSGERMKGKAAS
jgi:hypothetical protein